MGRLQATALYHDAPAQRVVVGEGAVGELATDLARVPDGKVAILASPRAWDSPLGAAVADAVGRRRRVLWHDVPPHTPLAIAEEAARSWKDADVRLLVAIGGGSASDLAKAVSMALATHGDLEEYFSRRAGGTVVDRKAECPVAPIVAVPSTLSGAELTPGAGVTRDGIKHVLWDEALAARSVLCETSAINELPAEVVQTTGMNAAAHCVEAVYSSRGNEFSDALAQRSLALLVEGMLRSLLLKERNARVGYALWAGASLAGQALAAARVCLHHAVCHVLGARYHVGHGEANAAMLGWVADFNRDASAEAQDVLLSVVRREALRVAEVELSAATLGEAIREVGRLIGGPTSLPDIGLATVDGDAVWDALRQERGLAFNPRPVEREDALELLRAAGATLVADGPHESSRTKGST